MQNLTAKQLYEQKERCIVTFGDFKFYLIAEYDVDESGRCKIYISPFYDDMNIVDTEPLFTKTDTAIAHIKKELKRVATDILKSLE